MRYEVQYCMPDASVTSAQVACTGGSDPSFCFRFQSDRRRTGTNRARKHTHDTRYTVILGVSIQYTCRSHTRAPPSRRQAIFPAPPRASSQLPLRSHNSRCGLKLPALSRSASARSSIGCTMRAVLCRAPGAVAELLQLYSYLDRQTP